MLKPCYCPHACPVTGDAATLLDDSATSTCTYHKFEPVTIDHNTEVKCRVTVVPVKQPDFDNDVADGTGSDQQDRFAEEYNRLIVWYRDLPEGMFVARILREYSHSESDLDGLRQLCFEALKSNDDFPFDLQAEMKRRMATRRGDTLPVKLANDIHKLVSVMEGEPFNAIKDLLSKAQP